MEDKEKKSTNKVLERTNYLSPSTINTSITKPKGNIIDTIPGQMLSLWSPITGKSLEIFPQIIGNLYCKILPINKNKLIITTDRKMKIFDLTEGIILNEFICEYFFDEMQEHKEANKIVGLSNGILSLWDIKEGKLIKKLNTGTKARSFVFLESGKYILRSKDSVVLIVDSSLTEWESANIQGFVYSICSIQNEDFALGRNQSVHIMNAEQNSIKSILKGFDEVYISLAYIKFNHRLVYFFCQFF